MSLTKHICSGKITKIPSTQAGCNLYYVPVCKKNALFALQQSLYLSLSPSLSLLFLPSLSLSHTLSYLYFSSLSLSLSLAAFSLYIFSLSTLYVSLSPLSLSLFLSLSLSTVCVAQQYKNVITPPPSLGNGVLRPPSGPPSGFHCAPPLEKSPRE
jgi:hypothetical protein